jgi:alpha-L-fucosidase
MPKENNMPAARVETPEGPFEPAWGSLKAYTVPDWYTDGKFGIFIHWGPYCVPAFGNEWYPRNMYVPHSAEHGFHTRVYGPVTEFGYKDFIPQFRAEAYDPAAWADLFSRAGARFVVPVAEHHDGFAMYDSDLTKWCAARMGPRRDIVGELADAVREAGMVFGVSSHRAEHWWYMNGGMAIPSDVQDPELRDFYGPAAPGGTQPDEDFLEDWLARCAELVDRYRPQLFWFDWWIEEPAFVPYLQRFAAYYYNRGAEWGEGVAINYKKEAFPAGAAVYDIERGQTSGIHPYFWQNDTAISRNSWGYINHHDYKTAGTLIGDLVDIVSKNGALLLNIGPRADGTIPEPERDILLDIGRWLEVNGEAIYGTRPWRVFGEGPTQVPEGLFTDAKRASFTSEDIRFTAGADTLYAIALAWPADGTLRIRGLGGLRDPLSREIADVQLLGCAAPVAWQRDEDALTVHLPSEKPCEHAYTLKITAR